MSDWDQLRELSHDVAPPDFGSLVDTARRRNRRARVAVAALASVVLIGGGLVLAAVNDPDVGPMQPADNPTPTEEVTLPGGVTALPGPDTGQEFATLGKGRYRVPLSDSLAFDVAVPSESYAHDDGLFIATGPVVLKSEVAGEAYGVPRHPCTSHSIEPVGPTVDDLVEAIRNQPVLRVSRPEPVELGGSAGIYLEVEVPSSYDASACVDGVMLPGYQPGASSWEPGYRGHWWILDVDGQRVVVAQNCGCGAERLARAKAIAESITFSSTG